MKRRYIFINSCLWLRREFLKCFVGNRKRNQNCSSWSCYFVFPLQKLTRLGVQPRPQSPTFFSCHYKFGDVLLRTVNWHQYIIKFCARDNTQKKNNHFPLKKFIIDTLCNSPIWMQMVGLFLYLAEKHKGLKKKYQPWLHWTEHNELKISRL